MMSYSRDWAIQYEPEGALRAIILRYLSIDRGISINKLSQMVFDDLMSVVFWSRCEPPEQGRPKVFCHGMGSSYMDSRRRNVEDDIVGALASLEEARVVSYDDKKKKIQLLSYEARALWLAKMPKEALVVYQGLRATHPGSENSHHGMDMFTADGALKDPRDEKIREQSLEIKQLKARLADVHAMLKIYQESEAKKLERQLK